LGKSDEKASRPADVAEPVGVLIAHDVAHELSATRAKPFKRLVEVVDGEHDAQVSQSVDRSVAVIGDDGGREEAGELEAAVPVRCAHHRDLDALIAKASDTSGPLPFDSSLPFQLKTEF